MELVPRKNGPEPTPTPPAPAPPKTAASALKAGLKGQPLVQQQAALTPPADEYSDSVPEEAQKSLIPGLGLGGAVALAGERTKPIRTWLTGHRAELVGSSQQAILMRVIKECPEAEPLPTAELGDAIKDWAATSGFNLVAPKTPGAGPPVRRADLLGVLKGAAPKGQAFATPEGATKKDKPKDDTQAGPTAADDFASRWHVSITGLTVDLLRGPLDAKAFATIGGTAGFTAKYGGVSFGAEFSSSSWTLSLTFPGTTHAPMLPGLSNVVGAAYGGICDMANKLGDRLGHPTGRSSGDPIDDLSKVMDELSPSMKNVSPALQALSGLVDQATQGGKVNAGVTASGPLGDAAKDGGGINVVATVTITL